MNDFVRIRYEDIVTPAWPIDDMPNLCASLGKEKVAIIRLHQGTVAQPETNTRTRYLNNTCLNFMQQFRPNGGGPVDDIIYGVAHSDTGSSNPLSTTRLHGLLQYTEVFSTPQLMDTLGVEERQARRYLLALKLCIKYIQRHADTCPPLPEEDEDDLILEGFTVSVIPGDH